MVVGSTLNDVLSVTAPTEQEMKEAAKTTSTKEPLSQQKVSHGQVLDLFGIGSGPRFVIVYKENKTKSERMMAASIVKHDPNTFNMTQPQLDKCIYYRLAVVLSL